MKKAIGSFVVAVIMSVISLSANADSPSVKLYYSSSDISCGGDCNSPHELYDSNAGGAISIPLENGIGVEVQYTNNNLGAGAYYNMYDKNDVSFRAGAGFIGQELELAQTNGYDAESVKTVSPFGFVEASYKFAFIRYQASYGKFKSHRAKYEYSFTTDKGQDFYEVAGTLDETLDITTGTVMAGVKFDF